MPAERTEDPSPKADFRVIALISAFNEGDIISPVIEHLVENEVDVYLIDNRSTDDTVEQAQKWLGKGLLKIESFPAGDVPPDHPSGEVMDWSAILRRKEELSRELQADWFIHHDADEIREGPWPNLTLKEAIRRVDTLGYNCIDFHVLNFRPVDNSFTPGMDPRTHFKFYEEAEELDHVQIKAWKSVTQPVTLYAGGHEVRFEGRRIFPVKFLLRHYPIRSQQQGARKIFQERKPRFLKHETEIGWHRQYNKITDESYQFLRDPKTLRAFDLDRVRFELTVPDALLENLRAERDRINAELSMVARERDELRKHVTNLEAQRETYQKIIDEIEADRVALRNRGNELEQRVKDLDAQYRELSVLVSGRPLIRRCATALAKILRLTPPNDSPG